MKLEVWDAAEVAAADAAGTIAWETAINAAGIAAGYAAKDAAMAVQNEKLESMLERLDER